MSMQRRYRMTLKQFSTTELSEKVSVLKTLDSQEPLPFLRPHLTLQCKVVHLRVAKGQSGKLHNPILDGSCLTLILNNLQKYGTIILCIPLFQYVFTLLTIGRIMLILRKVGTTLLSKAPGITLHSKQHQNVFVDLS